MDVYSLTRKPRPTHLTLGQNQVPPLRRSTSPNPPLPGSNSSNTQSSTQGRVVSAPGTPKAQNNGTLRDAVDGVNVARAGKVDTVGIVTGPPSREHWQPDSSASKCHDATCPTEFGLFERRHHCRRCGEIFCSSHCNNYIRLDQNNGFHQAGFISRSCDMCAADCDRWRSRVQGNSTSGAFVGTTRSSRKESVVSLSSSGGSTATSENTARGQGAGGPAGPGVSQHGPARPRRPLMGTGYKGEPGMMELGREDVVRPPGEQVPLDSSAGGINITNLQRHADPNLYPIPSVPADWQWSTF